MNGQAMDDKVVVQWAQALGPDGFAAKLPHVYLLVDLRRPPPVDDEVTDVVDFAPVVDIKPPRSHFEILPLTKRTYEGRRDQLSVGRGRTCDIVLRDPSVSRVHAHFRIGRDRRLRLIDNTSQNGTRIDGDPLIPERSSIVCVGDTVHFGTVRAVIMDASALYDLVAGRE